MSWIRFASVDELATALDHEAVPVKLAQRRVDYAFDADGAILVHPRRKLAKAVLELLTELGAQVVEHEPPDPSSADCWAQLLNPAPLVGEEFGGAPGGGPPRGPFLFDLPADVKLLELATEMLRLGCDRQQMARFVDPLSGEQRILIRAVDPPYYTLIRAADRERGLMAYVPTPPGQAGVWTEIGWRHPMSGQIETARGMLLIDRAGKWRELDAPDWVDVYSLTRFEAPAPEPCAPVEIPPRFDVRLRLVGSPERPAPSLWVLRTDAIAQADSLVRSLPQAELDRLLFAVGTREGAELVVLRARAGSDAPPAIVVQGETFAALRQLPQLHLPTGRMIEPPLRQEKLVELLCPDAEQVTWLAPVEGEGIPRGHFRPEQLPESSFRPLTDWVDYLVDRDAGPLQAWVKSAEFEFDPIIVALPSADPNAPRKERGKSRRRSAEPDPLPEEPDEAPLEIEHVEPPPRLDPIQRLVDYERRAPSELEQQLAGLERRFIELGGQVPADHIDRTTLWAEMAPLHYALENRRDGGQCWARYLWELPESGDGRAEDAAARWAIEEQMRSGSSADELVQRILDADVPERDEVRALAAQVIGAGGGRAPDQAAAVTERLHDIQLWLDGRDEAALDVRTTWLARRALARLADDSLALTRARDRVLGQLFQGMSVQRDLPTFLRFLGRPGEPLVGQSGLAMELVDRLEHLRTTYHGTPREPASDYEAAPELTGAYVDYLFSFAFARLGENERADALRQSSAAHLDLEDEVHALLVGIYNARINHALEGLSPQTPLPDELVARLDELDAFARYKVDRLRQWSEILEPLQRLDPFAEFVRQPEDDHLSRRLEALRGIEDPTQLDREVTSLLDAASAQDLERERLERILAALLQTVPRLGESRATHGLERLAPLIERLPSEQQMIPLEQGLKLSGHFGHVPLTRRYLALLEQLIRELDAARLAQLGPTVSAGLRTLRRLGLDDQGATLLDAMLARATGEEVQTTLARVRLAEGLAYFDRLDQAVPIFDQAQSAIEQGDLPMRDRLHLARALAKALHQAPQEAAFERLDRLAGELPNITDSYNTNSHYCLSVIHFVESLVLGHLNEDLALGELGRRWLDEDEYLVRRRIHRDYEAGV